jgi:hypothetical protein
MADLKDQLIRLGSTNPELRPHIRPVLAELQRTSKLNLMRDIVDLRAFGKLRSQARKGGDEQTADMLKDIFKHFSDRLQLDGGEEKAFNRLNNMLGRPPSDANMLRNQVAKIADLLGIKTPVNF